MYPAAFSIFFISSMSLFIPRDATRIFFVSATTGPRWGAKALFQGHRPLASTGQVTLEAFCDSRDSPGELSPSI